jgi:N utilization substance protein B
MSRRSSRKNAFKLIFQLPFHDDIDYEAAYSNLLTDLPKISEEDKTFIRDNFFGTVSHLAEVDALISKHLSGWTIDRISRADLAIMRIAVYEMCFAKMPPGVCVNEAVELAKEYGDDDSPAFVNALLKKLSETKNP